MNLTRRTTLGLMLATIAVPAYAADPTFNVDGMAIRGYDPVGYFTMSKPVKGDAAYTSDYNGATWAFSSADNKAMFDSNPEQYAPKYGGYCAYAVSKGATASTDPEAWTIHNGALYLNYSLNVRTIWSEDKDGNISKADKNWPGVLN